MKSKCKRHSRKQSRNHKNTRRGGSFPRYSTYFLKQMKTHSMPQLAQRVVSDNFGLGVGKIANTVKKYLLYKPKDTHISNARNETFKPEPTRYNNRYLDFIKPMNVFNPNSTVQKVDDLKYVHDRIGDIIYRREKGHPTVAVPPPPPLRNSRNSNSRNSRSRNSNRTMSPNRGP